MPDGPMLGLLTQARQMIQSQQQQLVQIQAQVGQPARAALGQARQKALPQRPLMRADSVKQPIAEMVHE